MGSSWLKLMLLKQTFKLFSITLKAQLLYHWMKQTCYARMGPQICQHLKVTTYKLHLLYILATKSQWSQIFFEVAFEIYSFFTFLHELFLWNFSVHWIFLENTLRNQRRNENKIIQLRLQKYFSPIMFLRASYLKVCFESMSFSQVDPN